MRRRAWGAEGFPRPTLALAGCCILAAMASGSMSTQVVLVAGPSVPVLTTSTAPEREKAVQIPPVSEGGSDVPFPDPISNRQAGIPELAAKSGAFLMPYPTPSPAPQLCDSFDRDDPECPISTLVGKNASTPDRSAIKRITVNFCCLAAIHIRQKCTPSTGLTPLPTVSAALSHFCAPFPFPPPPPRMYSDFRADDDFWCDFTLNACTSRRPQLLQNVRDRGQ